MASALVERFDGEVPTDARGPRHAPRRRPQDRQRGAQRGVRPPRPARRHPRRAARRRLGLTDAGRPGEGRARAEHLPPAAERGRFSLRMILHGRRVCDAQKPAVRALRARGHLPVEPAAATAGATRRTPRHDVAVEHRCPSACLPRPAVCMIGSPTRFPPPGLQRQPGSAAWRRPERRPLPPGAVAVFGSVESSRSSESCQAPTAVSGAAAAARSARAQRSLGLVDRGDEVRRARCRGDGSARRRRARW